MPRRLEPHCRKHRSSIDASSQGVEGGFFRADGLGPWRPLPIAVLAYDLEHQAGGARLSVRYWSVCRPAPDWRRSVPVQAAPRGRHHAGEATYAVLIQPGEEIIAGSNQHYRVLDVVPFGEGDESEFVGMLKVEAA